jgi:hypothetical protein
LLSRRFDREIILLFFRPDKYALKRYDSIVSAAEIINELPKLTPSERLSVLVKLHELVEDAAIPASAGDDKLNEPPSPYRTIYLSARGIGPEQAADLRARLKTCLEDWERPEASIYDEDQAR